MHREPELHGQQPSFSSIGATMEVEPQIVTATSSSSSSEQAWHLMLIACGIQFRWALQ